MSKVDVLKGISLKSKVDVLKALYLYEDIADALDLMDKEVEEIDETINSMEPYDLVSVWCGWEIGDPGHWDNMYYMFKQLEKVDL